MLIILKDIFLIIQKNILAYNSYESCFKYIVNSIVFWLIIKTNND